MASASVGFLVLLVAAATSGVSSLPASSYAAAAPPPVQQQQYEPYEERDYKFSYSVRDGESYNEQSRDEEKRGNTVTGQYSVLEPSGELRLVSYVADDAGFRAEVTKSGSSAAAAAPAAPPSYN